MDGIPSGLAHHAQKMTWKPEVTSSSMDMKEGISVVQRGLKQCQEAFQYLTEHASNEAHQLNQAWWRIRDLQERNRELEEALGVAVLT